MGTTNYHKHYDKYKRDKEARSFYKSKAWAKCRVLALQRDNHLCQECFRNKKINNADLVHHIKELRDYPDLALDIDNLESLCNSCHNKEHPDKGKKEKKPVSSKIRVIKG